MTVRTDIKRAIEKAIRVMVRVIVTPFLWAMDEFLEVLVDVQLGDSHLRNTTASSASPSTRHQKGEFK